MALSRQSLTLERSTSVTGPEAGNETVAPTTAAPTVQIRFRRGEVLAAVRELHGRLRHGRAVGLARPAQLPSGSPTAVVVLAFATTVPPSICAPFFVFAWVPVQLLSVPVNVVVVFTFLVASPGEANGNPGEIVAAPVSVQLTLPVTGFAAAIPGAMMTVESANAPEPTNAILRNMRFSFLETTPSSDGLISDNCFDNGVPAAG